MVYCNRATAARTTAAMGLAQEGHEPDQANQVESGLLAGMQSEQKDPMHASVSLPTFAREHAVSERMPDYRAKIGDAREHLLGIINGVQDFSSEQAGRPSVQNAVFELKTVMDDVTSFMEQKAQQFDLQLHVEHEVSPVLIGDPLRIGQILINFSSNAIKCSARGQVRIHVDVLTRSEGEVKLLFEVGYYDMEEMSKEQESKLFQFFASVDGSADRRARGLHLGMTICRRLAQSMGGEIGIKSLHGEGFILWFTACLGVPARGPHCLHAINNGLNDKVVLLVEGSERSQRQICALLSEAGLGIQVVKDAREAASLVLGRTAYEKPYEMVLVDLDDPGRHDLLAIELIRETYSARELPIVAIAANAQGVEWHAGLEAGVSDVLTWPMTLAQLRGLLLRRAQHHCTASADGQRHAAPTAGVPEKELPARIDGLDLERGLALMGHNRNLYLDSLQAFVTTRDGVIKEVRRLLLAGELVKAVREVDMLKAQAGYLGATRLQQVAGVLEDLLSKKYMDADAVGPLLNRAERHLALLLKSVRLALAQ